MKVALALQKSLFEQRSQRVGRPEPNIVDRRYAVNKVEAKLVRRIFKLATQQQSCLKIAETLNAEGFRSKVFTTKTGKTMGGKHYTGRLINNILTDAKYIGKIVHKGQSYDAEHPAILSQEHFEQVRNVLQSNRVYTHRHQAKRIAMLRRLVHCSHCGSVVMPAWTNNHGREYRYYTCAKKVKTGYSKCALPSLPAGELEKTVIDQLRSLIRHPDVIAHTYREVCAGSQTGPDPEVLAQLEELRQSRQQTHLAARSLLDLKDPDGPLVKSELKRLNEQMKRPDDSIRNLESATTSTSTVDLAEIIHAISRLDLLSEFLPSFETPPRLLTPSGDRGTR